MFFSINSAAFFSFAVHCIRPLGLSFLLDGVASFQVSELLDSGVVGKETRSGDIMRWSRCPLPSILSAVHSHRNSSVVGIGDH